MCEKAEHLFPGEHKGSSGTLSSYFESPCLRSVSSTSAGKFLIPVHYVTQGMCVTKPLLLALSNCSHVCRVPELHETSEREQRCSQRSAVNTTGNEGPAAKEDGHGERDGCFDLKSGSEHIQPMWKTQSRMDICVFSLLTCI